jgi:predicted ester cyclase
MKIVEGRDANSQAWRGWLVVLGLALAGAAEGPALAGEAGRAPDHKEHNKALARRVYEEGLSQGKFEVPYTDDFVGHGGLRDFTHADGIAEAQGWRTAFPDLVVVADRLVAEGDLVAVRWTARGTNTAAGNGLPATGKRVQVSGMTLFRFAAAAGGFGAIAEEWTCGDSLGILRQLGLLPAASASPTPAPVKQ